MQSANKRRVRWFLLATAGVLAIAAAAFLVWALTPLGPTDSALAALESDEFVTVTQTPEALVFKPASSEPTVGAILYPGGRVDVRSYAPLAREIAQRNQLVALVPMPLSLAVLDIGAAQGVIDAHPEIGSWTIGGHSLGGAMATEFIADNPDAVDGLVLMAAYPVEGNDLSGSGLAVTTLLGTEDGIVDEATFRESLGRLPADAAAVTIEGGNHAQFGDYGTQRGDGVATLPADEQWLYSADAFEDVAARVANPTP